MLHSRNHLRQALAALAPVPFPIGKPPLQGSGMSRLEFPERRKVPQLGMKLETLPVAIQHPQQRRFDKLTVEIAGLTEAEGRATATRP
jgi:hypothetical protein